MQLWSTYVSYLLATTWHNYVIYFMYLNFETVVRYYTFYEHILQPHDMYQFLYNIIYNSRKLLF